jgi:hypothetical protein
MQLVRVTQYFDKLKSMGERPDEYAVKNVSDQILQSMCCGGTISNVRKTLVFIIPNGINYLRLLLSTL